MARDFRMEMLGDYVKKHRVKIAIKWVGKDKVFQITAVRGDMMPTQIRDRSLLGALSLLVNAKEQGESCGVESEIRSESC